MKTKKPLILNIELGLFYGALASFSLGIATQQIVLHLFALFQLLVGLFYGVRLGTLFMPGRRAAMVFLVVTMICAVVGQYKYPAEDATRIHWAIAAFWVIAPAIVFRADWNILYKTLVVVSLPGMAFSVFWLLRPDEIQWAFKAGFESYPRAFGFVSNPITYAEGLVVLACWTTARFSFGQPGKVERRWMLLHLACSVLIVLFSRVRAGLVGFVVLFIVNAILSPRYRRQGIAAAVLLPLLFLPVTGIFGFNTASLTERLELAENSISLLAENPIFGIGPNKFNREIEGVGLLTRHPHNTLLGIATEFGVFGLLAYLAFMYSLARRLLDLLKKFQQPGHEMTWVVRALFCAFITYHLLGLFDYNYADTELLILHALHWGTLAHLGAVPKPPQAGAAAVDPNMGGTS